ncbi:MAG: ABC transporter ATP-binding protein [Bacteroidetes bacterium]|nr:ABC transporter ATP-binding protein [Bacteroidota bacterium]
MKIEINHTCADYDSFRAEKVKSLFNPESGHTWGHIADLPIEDDDWQIGLVVGPSGSGKSSTGKKIWGEDKIYDLYDSWDTGKPIVDCIGPEHDFRKVTGALASVGLGDVPAWLRPFHVLSNGEQYRAGLARLIIDAPNEAVVDEFTSVVDRQIAQIGAAAFAKAWRRNKEKRVILLSCHYDVEEWLQPDWVYDTRTGEVKKKLNKRPDIKLDIWKVNGGYWKFFKPHYYLDLPHPPCAEYFVGTVNNELVAHLAVTPLFTAGAYRATRLVVMPEWQGVGVAGKFLDYVCRYHLEGNGRKERSYPTFFHTSHPQLCAFLRRAKGWLQTGAILHGSNKKRSGESLSRTSKSQIFKGSKTGYGGHFRAIQSFKFIG